MVQMPLVMAPHVATQPQQATFPWVTSTPEQSPMLWECAPAGYYQAYTVATPTCSPVHKGNFVQPEMPSKELLRSVCEPFFEQMLAAVQQAMRAQSQHTSEMPWPSKGSNSEEGSSIVSDSGFSRMQHSQEGPAFSSLFGCQSSGSVTEEEESVESGQIRSSNTLLLGGALKLKADAQTKTNVEAEDVQRSEDAESQYQELVGEPPPGSDQQKNTMVCRHWKSKGFCRMEAQCKFLHPDNKCGVRTLGKNGGASIGDICNSLVFAYGLSDQLAVAAMDVKNKKSGGKRRRNKGRGEGMPVIGKPLAMQLIG